MGKVENIEKEIKALTTDELRSFRTWFWTFDAEVWDRQFENDAVSGKLDTVAEAALKSYRAGNCSEI
ncbi:MAG: hypothetical protein OHK006_08000 [Thermodesulfovibrionales bacterium]